ncbi:hypothetical protein GSI_13197 [Ganoderma sinense ZZ0214-1]|uniref:Uncharacterized protein n=1 Tax=Ganoderma sinense ZZ0214-1 TaxID=1077348 RepID=A0A2G8RVF6_9APHY|nr:hypothetical protein GSI_13197 [Ganoderma sinense ZZ0214-1]
MDTSKSTGPKYGEKGARMKNYRQRHQAPMALQRAMGNDRMCMEMCPSPGLHVDKLGDRADPLPPERKRRYEKKKARVQAVNAGDIQSRHNQIKGPRKMAAKKPLAVKNTTPPPEQPPPFLTVFPAAPPPPVPHLPTTQSAASDDRRASSSPFLPEHALAPSTSPWLTVSRYSTDPACADIDAPPMTVKNDQRQNTLDAMCFEFSAAPEPKNTTLSNVWSPTSTPSLESDCGTPSAVQSPPTLGTSWAEGAQTTTPPSSYTVVELDHRASAEQEDASEVLFNEVYQSFFIPRSSWTHPPPTPGLEQEHRDVSSVVPKTRHPSWDAVPRMPDLLFHIPPSQPTTMDPPVLCTRDSPYQGRDSGNRYMPATASSRASRAPRSHGPASRGASSTTGAPAPRVRRHIRATFDPRHAPRPYPSRSDQSAAGHAHLSHYSLAVAEHSVVPRCAVYGGMPPITAIKEPQAQLRQYGGFASLAHAPQDDARHLSTRSLSSHAHTIHTSSIPPTGTASAPLLDEPSIAPPIMQAGIGATTVPTVHASLYPPQVWSGAIASSTTNVAGILACNAHWQNHLPTASHLVPASPGIDTAVLPGTSHAHAAKNDTMARTFGGRFEGELFRLNITVPLLGMDLAIGQSLDGTYLVESSTGSQSDLHQQLLTTSTW